MSNITESPTPQDSSPRVLARPNEGRWLGGVVGAFAAYMSWPVGWLRLVVFLAFFIAPGWSVFLLYVAAWIAIPTRVQQGSAAVGVRREELRWAGWGVVVMFTLMIGIALLLFWGPVLYNVLSIGGPSVLSTFVIGVVLVLLGVFLLIDRKRSERTAKQSLFTPAYGGVTTTRPADTPLVNQRSLLSKGIRFTIAAALVTIVISDSALVTASVFAGALVLLTGVAFVKKQSRKVAFFSVPVIAMFVFAATLGIPYNARFALNTTTLGNEERMVAFISANHNTYISPADTPAPGMPPATRTVDTGFGFGSENVIVRMPESVSEGINDRDPKVFIDYDVRLGKIEIVERSSDNVIKPLKTETGTGLKASVVNGDGPNELHVKVNSGVGTVKVTIDRL